VSARRTCDAVIRKSNAIEQELNGFSVNKNFEKEHEMRVSTRKSNGRTGRATAGFTLVETLMAVGLGSFMIGTLYSGFASGISAMRTTREDLRATQIMLGRVERLRLCTWSQITNPASNPPTTTDYFDTANQQVPYTVTYQAATPAVGTLPDAYRTNMLLVTLETTWTSGGIQHQRSMQTYVARYGMEGYISTGH
jgi:uncharacterized protein (TIGR02598 family)